MVRALERLKEQGADPTSRIQAYQGSLEAGQEGSTQTTETATANVPNPPAIPIPPTQAAVPRVVPPAQLTPVADVVAPELPSSQRTSVLLTSTELDILDRFRGMRLPNRVRLNDSDIIRAAMQHLNTLTDAQIAEILSRTAPLRRGRK